jgi:hypothetical protein
MGCNCGKPKPTISAPKPPTIPVPEPPKTERYGRTRKIN